MNRATKARLESVAHWQEYCLEPVNPGHPCDGCHEFFTPRLFAHVILKVPGGETKYLCSACKDAWKELRKPYLIAKELMR